jgi:hypothetical protein
MVLSACFLALSVASMRADDQRPPVDMSMQPSFRRQADLADWLKKNMVPGQTRPRDVFPVFGTRYWHPWHPGGEHDEHGNIRLDNSTFVFNLDELGVQDQRQNGQLVFLVLHFDPQSCRLLSAGIEEVERQTGFHLEAVSGP